MKKLLFNLLAFGALTIFAAGGVQAQNDKPQPSPAATITQKIGLTEVTVNYSRPSARNRQIFGDLVPYGKPWRTGANAATTITFKDAMTVEGNKVPAGEYALYTIPGKNEWTVVLNKNTKLGGETGKYNNAEDVARFKVKPEQLPSEVETFTINFADLTTYGAVVELKWENTGVRFKVESNPDGK